jgi:hypothetical protein
VLDGSGRVSATRPIKVLIFTMKLKLALFAQIFQQSWAEHLYGIFYAFHSYLPSWAEHLYGIFYAFHSYLPSLMGTVFKMTLVPAVFWHFLCPIVGGDSLPH